jgi:hypothetical protein
LWSLSSSRLLEIETTNGFLKLHFQLLFPGLTLVSLLESESGFEIVTQLADTGKRPSSNL